MKAYPWLGQGLKFSLMLVVLTCTSAKADQRDDEAVDSDEENAVVFFDAKTQMVHEYMVADLPEVFTNGDIDRLSEAKQFAQAKDLLAYAKLKGTAAKPYKVDQADIDRDGSIQAYGYGHFGGGFGWGGYGGFGRGFGFGGWGYGGGWGGYYGGWGGLGLGWGWAWPYLWYPWWGLGIW